jgi:predicted Zn-dependent protease
MVLQVVVPGYLLERLLELPGKQHPILRFIWVLACGLGLTIVLGGILRYLNIPVSHYLLVLHGVLLVLALIKPRSASDEPAWRLERRNAALYLLVFVSCLVMFWAGFQRTRVHFDMEVPTVYAAEVNWLADEAPHFDTPDRWIGFTAAQQSESRTHFDGWTYTEASWSWASGVPASELLWNDVTPIFIWVLPLIAFATAYLLSQREDVAAWSAAALTIFALFTIDPLVYPHNENTLYFGAQAVYLDTVRAASTMLVLPLAIFTLLGYLKHPHYRRLIPILLLGHALAFMRVRQIFALEIVAGATMLFWWLASISYRQTRTALLLLLVLLTFAILPIQMYIQPTLQSQVYLSQVTDVTINPASIVAHADSSGRTLILEGVFFRILYGLPLLGDTFIIDPATWFYTPLIGLMMLLGLAAGWRWRRSLAAQYLFGTTFVITVLVFVPGITEVSTRIFGSAATVNLLEGLNFALPGALALGFAAAWVLNRYQRLRKLQTGGTVVLAAFLLVILFEPIPMLYGGPRDQIQAMNLAQGLRDIAPFDQRLLADLPTVLDPTVTVRVLAERRTAGFLVETFPNIFVPGWESPPDVIGATQRFFDSTLPFVDTTDLQFLQTSDFTHLIIAADNPGMAQLFLQPERYQLLLNSAGFLVFKVNESAATTEADRLFSQMNTLYATISQPRWDKSKFMLARSADPAPWETLAAAWQDQLTQQPSDLARYGLAFTDLLMNRDTDALPLWEQLYRAHSEIPLLADVLAYTRHQLGDDQDSYIPLLQNLNARQPYIRVLAARTLLTDTFFYLLTSEQVDQIIQITKNDALTWDQVAQWMSDNDVRARTALLMSAQRWDIAEQWLTQIAVQVRPSDLVTLAALHLMRGDFDGALALLQPATDPDWLTLRRYLHPDRWTTDNNSGAQLYYLLQGAVAQRANQWTEAEADYRQAIESGASQVGRYFLAQTLLSQGQTEQSQTVMDQLNTEWQAKHQQPFPTLVSMLVLIHSQAGLVIDPTVEQHSNALTVSASFANFVPALPPQTWQVFVISPDASIRYGETEVPALSLTGALVRAGLTVTLPTDLPPLTPARVVIKSLASNTIVYSVLVDDTVLNLPPAAHMPSDAQRMTVPIGDHITLEGYTAQITDKKLTLTLYWQTNAKLSEDDHVFVHILNSVGDLATQSDSAPLDGQYPTSAWAVNTLIEDIHRIPLNLNPGDYRIDVGLYRLTDLSRLPIASGVQQAENDAVLLLQFTVPDANTP